MKRSFRSKTMEKYRKACSKYVNGVLRLYQSGNAGDVEASKNSTIWNFSWKVVEAATVNLESLDLVCSHDYGRRK